MYKGQTAMVIVYVVEGDGPSLFDCDWLEHFGLDWKMIAMATVERNSKLEPMLQKYKRLFSKDLGTVRDIHVEAKLELKPHAVPGLSRPRPVPFALKPHAVPGLSRLRPVPFALKPKIDKELDRLVELRVSEHVTHSDWASPIVPVPKKDGQVRICGDYKVSVNKALVVDQHPLPSPDELFTALTGGQQFYKIDLSQAYRQLIVHPDSRKYTSINTH